MYKTKSCFLILVLMLIIIGWFGETQSQEKYPTRAIEIIVPFAPGGGTDLAARIVAGYVSKKWGIPVNVVNKPGGNTIPACLEVYNAKPDGYTLLGDSQSSTSALGAAVKNLPFKVMDRTFIGMTSIGPFFLMVSPTSPFNNLKELADEARKEPENFTWTSTGGASGLDFTGRQFFKAIGVDVPKTKPVMVPGGAPAVSLTAGGHVKMGLGASSAMPAIKGGMVKTLAITTKTRWPDLPNIPTTEEQGFPTIDVQYWTGLSGPPKLPSHIVEKWDKILQEALKDPDIVSAMRNIGVLPFYRNENGTKEYVIKEIEEVNTLWGLK
ncbi:MAG: tripartite tricarboxylate transporter substrate binding protein [Thermodesulfobacteriota bacterium]|nr:tripartite tricarboxylate transporter substrate binding protein [Thermodesulfobacteriota bacterium]